MYEILVIMVLALLVFKFFSAKIHIKWYTFFKRGFKKFDNNFRFILLYWKAGKR